MPSWGSRWLETEAACESSPPDASANDRSQPACSSGRQHGTRWFNVVQGIRRSLDVHLKSYYKVDSAFASTQRHTLASDKLRALARALTDTGLIDFCCVYLVHPTRGTFGIAALSGAGSELYPPVLSEEAKAVETGPAPSLNVFTRSVFQVQDSNWAVEDVVSSKAPWYYDCCSAVNGFGLPQEAGWLRRVGMRSVLALPCMAADGEVTGVVTVATRQKTLDHLLLRKLEELCYKLTPIVSAAVSEHSRLLSNRRLVGRYESIDDFAHAVLGEMLNLDRAIATSVATANNGGNGCSGNANGVVAAQGCGSAYSAANPSQQRQAQRQASIAAAVAAADASCHGRRSNKHAAADAKFDAAAAVAAAAAAGFSWTAPDVSAVVSSSSAMVAAPAAAPAAAAKQCGLGGVLARLRKSPSAKHAATSSAASSSSSPAFTQQQQRQRPTTTPVVPNHSGTSLRDQDSFCSAITCDAGNGFSSGLLLISNTAEFADAPLPPTYVSGAAASSALPSAATAASAFSSGAEPQHHRHNPSVSKVNTSRTLPSRPSPAISAVADLLRLSASRDARQRRASGATAPADVDHQQQQQPSRSTRSLSCLEFSCGGVGAVASDALSSPNSPNQPDLGSSRGIFVASAAPPPPPPSQQQQPAVSYNSANSPFYGDSSRPHRPAAAATAAAAARATGQLSGRSAECGEFMLHSAGNTGDFATLPAGGGFMIYGGGGPLSGGSSRAASHVMHRGVPLEPSIGARTVGSAFDDTLASAFASGGGANGSVMMFSSGSNPQTVVVGAATAAATLAAARAVAGGDSTCATDDASVTAADTSANLAAFSGHTFGGASVSAAAAHCAGGASDYLIMYDGLCGDADALAEAPAAAGRWSRDSAAAAAAMWGSEASDAIASAMRFTSAATSAAAAGSAAGPVSPSWASSMYLAKAPSVPSSQPTMIHACRTRGGLYGIRESGPVPSAPTSMGGLSGGLFSASYSNASGSRGSNDDCGVMVMDCDGVMAGDAGGGKRTQGAASSEAAATAAAGFSSGLCLQKQQQPLNNAQRLYC